MTTMFSTRRVFMGVAAAALMVAATGTGALAQSSSITIWVGSWWEPQIPVAQELWAKDHPDVTLNIQALPINGYLDKFTAAALGGSPPDIVDVDTTWVSTVAAQGLLQPLDDIVPQLPVADIAPAVWKGSQFKGVQYAIPNRSGPGIYYYNMTAFDKAGVPYPTNDWNYDDLLEMVQKLNIPGEQYGIGIPADISDPSNVSTMFAPILWAMGGDFLTADGTAPAINNAEGVKAITYWSDLYLKYKVAPEGTPNFTTTRDIQPLFEANKIALIAQGSNAFDAFAKNPDLKWGMALMPSGVSRGGGWTMGVPVGAANPEGAKQFLIWLSQPEIMAKVMNRTPSNLKAQAMAPWNDPAKAIFSEAEKGARSVPSVAGWFQMQESTIVELQKILVGQSTPQEAADAAAAKIAQIIADNQ